MISGLDHLIFYFYNSFLFSIVTYGFVTVLKNNSTGSEFWSENV